MWSILKYLVNSVERKEGNQLDPVENADIDPLLDDRSKVIENYIKNYADNYVISLHYLDFPVIFCYGQKTIPTNNNFVKITDYVEPYKELTKIISRGQADVIHGFYFIQKQLEIRKSILESKDQETFDRLASTSGLEPYVINDLRTIWKNKRFEYLKSALARKIEVLYKPDESHPLYRTVIKYLEDVYRRGVDRFKTFICVGSTFIGKSVFFTKFLVPEQYFVYHSNFLEYSKMADQPKKIFRILDDIHWEQVSSTELKALMNRNISSVNIKYGYEYIFPLIPIIIMNGEDYKLFKSHFSDIWEFIERNAVIYPPQHRGDEEETTSLFTKEISTNIEDDYIFNNIIDIRELEKCNEKNMNEWIRSELVKTCAWKYDTTKYIQLPEPGVMKIPNSELSKKCILKEYEEFLLRKKQKEIENEKKPKEPSSTRDRWSDVYRYIPYRNKQYKKDDLEVLDEKESKYDSESEDPNSEDEFSSDDSSGSSMSSDEDDDDEKADNNGFIEL